MYVSGLFQAAESLDDLLLGAGVVAGLGVDDLAFGRDNKGLRGVNHVHSTLEIVVHIVKAGERGPAAGLGESTGLGGETDIVSGNDYELKVDLLLPVVVSLINCINLLNTRITGNGPE